MRTVHHDGGDHPQLMFDLDEIARQGVRRMLAEALDAEVQDYLEAARGASAMSVAALWFAATAMQK